MTTTNTSNKAQGAKKLTKQEQIELRMQDAQYEADHGLTHAIKRDEYGREIPRETEKEGIITEITETEEAKKKERKPNTIYTLKSFRDHINKLATYKVCTAEEIAQLRKIHKAATERWIGLTMEE